MLTVFLKWVKKLFYKHLLSLRQSSLGLLEAKNKEKVKSNIFFFFDQAKNQLAHFGGPKKFWKIFNFEFFIWRLFFEVLGRYLQIFLKYIFLRSLWFEEEKKFAEFLELDS